MKHKLFMTALCTISIAAGVVYTFIGKHWLFVNWNLPHFSLIDSKQPVIQKKQIILKFWKSGSWHQEEATILAGETTAQQIKSIGNQWLALAHEEHIITKPVVIEQVVMSPSCKDAYLSFNTNPLEPHWPAHKKFHCIQGLLKTVQNNLKTGINVIFLVQHQPIDDNHLDFSQPWPLIQE